MLVWNDKIEKMDRNDLEILQVDRLNDVLKRLTGNVPFYQNLYEKNKIDINNVKSLKDLQNIPFTNKADMQASYPYDMFAVPLEQIVRIHSSSGTTGQPTVVGYTKADLDNWSELIARILTAAGVTSKDIVQIAFGYGMFTGGFGLHYGVEKVGASVIPVSSGNTARQLLVMQDFKSTALVCTPSYAIYLAEAIKDNNIDREQLSLRVGLFGAEPWTDSMRKEIEAGLCISALDNYGLSEVMGPGVSFECPCKDGMHINEDHFIAEIIDPATGKVLPYGSIGELVLSTITKEGIPIIRYRTRDITSLNNEPCDCGRTFIRMSKPHGRTDDMLIIRGVNVFPSQIETVLINLDETNPHYQLIVTREGALDNLEVKVEVNEQYFSDEMRMMRRIEEKIKGEIKSALGLSAKITLVEPKSLERTEGKAKRVIDKRDYY